MVTSQFSYNSSLWSNSTARKLVFLRWHKSTSSSGGMRQLVDWWTSNKSAHAWLGWFTELRNCCTDVSSGKENNQIILSIFTFRISKKTKIVFRLFPELFIFLSNIFNGNQSEQNGPLFLHIIQPQVEKIQSLRPNPSQWKDLLRCQLFKGFLWSAWQLSVHLPSYCRRAAVAQSSKRCTIVQNCKCTKWWLSTRPCHHMQNSL